MKNGITMEKIRDANNTIQSLKPYVIELGREIGFFNSEWKFSDYSIISKPDIDVLFLIAYQNKNIAHTRTTTVPLSYLFDEKGTHKDEYNKNIRGNSGINDCYYKREGEIIMSWEFFNSETRKAIKPHKCTLCGKDIVPGERYTYSVGKWCGEFQQQYLHKTCENIIDYYIDETDENEWSEDEIVDWLRELECYDCKKYENDECIIDECTETAFHCPIIRKKYKKEEN